MKKKILSMVAVLLMAVTAQAQEDYIVVKYDGARPNILDTEGDEITFTIPVTNTGKVAGAETVQLYISDVEASVERPVKELKAFQKVYLQPGETRQVSLTIDKRALSFYDEANSQWKAEPGKFEALAGTSSDKIVSRCSFILQ